MIMQSTPRYAFISTGEKTMMYTLKVLSQDLISTPGGGSATVLNDYYVQNLSTDQDKAIAKAQRIAGDMGILFKRSAELFDLAEIRRRKAGEVQADRDAQERFIQERQEALLKEFNEQVVEGMMLCGKHVGLTSEEIADQGDVDYLVYAASQHAPEAKFFSKWLVNCKVAFRWLEKNPQRKSQYIGTVGQKHAVPVTVKFVSGTGGPFPSVRYLCEDNMGNRVVFLTVAKAFKDIDKGDSFEVMGTVKKHEQNTYAAGNPKETVLNRVKLIK